MIIYKAHKYRLYPTIKQQILLNKNFGAVRFLWNQLVANFNSYGSETYLKNLSEVELKKTNHWMKEAISYAIQQKRMDFVEFQKQFFNKKRKSKLGKPKFKKKGIANDSFRIPGQALCYNNCIKDNRLKIPKIGLIKIILDRPIEGQIRSITFSKNKVGEYYASILLECEIEQKEKKHILTLV